MKEQVLLHVDYVDTKGKFWQGSYVKNKIVTIKEDIHKTIHDTILENDYVELCYKSKPRTNIFIDTKEGTPKKVGYIYRGKTEIEGKRVFFDVWVTIKKIVDYPIIDLLN